MIVCVCRRISDRDITRHARAGMGFDDIQMELGVATQCGRCEECARDIVAQCSPSYPVAALSRDAGFSSTQLDGSIEKTSLWTRPHHAALA
ncbi:MAG: (2Fe-2S)-binding protein [Gallionella sp.]|nr:(2Fe-2S)-binding protein [Gallionella sp.]